MNTGNEALDRRNKMEMRHEVKWSGRYVTPTSWGPYAEIRGTSVNQNAV